jgi:alpha-aminoadipic semialdehyde synthase
MSVDILPASLPLDASKHFSSVLLPYLSSLIKKYTSSTEEGDEYTPALGQATIAEDGVLIGKHKWLHHSVDKFYAENTGNVQKHKVEPKPVGVVRKKKLLMLGSGMVAGPAVDHIAKREDVQLVVGESFRMYFWFVLVLMDFLFGG